MKVDCIIPYCDEGLRPLNVVEAILSIKEINKIITIDDGSQDNKAFKIIKSRHPQIISLKLKKNLGKAEAVKEGMKFATSPYIFLLDGDLSNIKEAEITDGFLKIAKDNRIDMIIFRRIIDKTVLFSKFIRHDTIFSGQRILKREDLTKVLNSKIEGYKLELSINSYMINNHKKVYWMPLSVYNPSKQKKWGYLKGIFKIGIPSFFKYMISRDIIYQTFFYCRDKAP
ncbi:glycosyltransferase [Patescibacteria group bacterium]|nr:glycosyltransferase [Patescibacteria group bacterium]